MIDREAISALKTVSKQFSLQMELKKDVRHMLPFLVSIKFQNSGMALGAIHKVRTPKMQFFRHPLPRRTLPPLERAYFVNGPLVVRAKKCQMSSLCLCNQKSAIMASG